MKVKTAIRERALALGFDACQFTTARPPDSAAQFQRWLEAGRHGQMTYLQRNAHKRIAPSQVLAEARSIIALAVSYAEGEAGQIPAAASGGQRTARPTGLLPLLHTLVEERAGGEEASTRFMERRTAFPWRAGDGPGCRIRIGSARGDSCS